MIVKLSNERVREILVAAAGGWKCWSPDDVQALAQAVLDLRIEVSCLKEIIEPSEKVV